jgi:hypothetical protein
MAQILHGYPKQEGHPQVPDRPPLTYLKSLVSHSVRSARTNCSPAALNIAFGLPDLASGKDSDQREANQAVEHQLKVAFGYVEEIPDEQGRD